MKKHLYGIVFAAAMCAAAAGMYFIVLHTQASYPLKLIFSGMLLLLALITGIVASSKTKDEKARAVSEALNKAESCGIGVYADGEFVFANRFYTETEQNESVNIYKLSKELKQPEGYSVIAEKHGEYTVIFVKKSPVCEKSEEEATKEIAEEKEPEENGGDFREKDEQ